MWIFTEFLLTMEGRDAANGTAPHDVFNLRHMLSLGPAFRSKIRPTIHGELWFH